MLSIREMSAFTDDSSFSAVLSLDTPIWAVANVYRGVWYIDNCVCSNGIHGELASVTTTRAVYRKNRHDSFDCVATFGIYPENRAVWKPLTLTALRIRTALHITPVVAL